MMLKIHHVFQLFCFLEAMNIMEIKMKQEIKYFSICNKHFAVLLIQKNDIILQ